MDRVLSRVTPSQPEAFTYRVFYLDQRGVVCRAEVIDASSDVEACRIAASLESAYGIILWERSRFLAQYPARSSAAECIARAVDQRRSADVTKSVQADEAR